MVSKRNRVEVMHGVNPDMLGRRDKDIYGTTSELEVRIKRFARQLNLRPRSSTRIPRAAVGLHRLPERADAAIINAGA